MKNINEIINESIKHLLKEYTEISETIEGLCNYIYKIILYMNRNNTLSFTLPNNMINFYGLNKYNIKTLTIKLIENVSYNGEINMRNGLNPIINIYVNNKNIQNTIRHEITHLIDYYEEGFQFFKEIDKNSLFNLKNIIYDIFYLYDNTEINARLNSSIYNIKNNLQYFLNHPDEIKKELYEATNIKYMASLRSIVKFDKYALYRVSEYLNKPYSVIYGITRSLGYLKLTYELPKNKNEFLVIKKEIISQLQKRLNNLLNDMEIITNNILSHKF